jgi:hypothetical protein
MNSLTKLFALIVIGLISQRASAQGEKIENFTDFKPLPLNNNFQLYDIIIRKSGATQTALIDRSTFERIIPERRDIYSVDRINTINSSKYSLTKELKANTSLLTSWFKTGGEFDRIKTIEIEIDKGYTQRIAGGANNFLNIIKALPAENLETILETIEISEGSKFDMITEILVYMEGKFNVYLDKEIGFDISPNVNEADINATASKGVLKEFEVKFTKPVVVAYKAFELDKPAIKKMEEILKKKRDDNEKSLISACMEMDFDACDSYNSMLLASKNILRNEIVMFKNDIYLSFNDKILASYLYGWQLNKVDKFTQLETFWTIQYEALNMIRNSCNNPEECKTSFAKWKTNYSQMVIRRQGGGALDITKQN